jgi:hypothetical protein
MQLAADTDYQKLQVLLAELYAMLSGLRIQGRL